MSKISYERPYKVTEKCKVDPNRASWGVQSVPLFGENYELIQFLPLFIGIFSCELTAHFSGSFWALTFSLQQWFLCMTLEVKRCMQGASQANVITLMSPQQMALSCLLFLLSYWFKIWVLPIGKIIPRY